MPHRREANILRHPGLQPLWDGLQNEWKQQQIAAVILLLTGISLLAASVLEKSIWFGFFGALAASSSLYWLFRLSQQKPVSELYHIFKERPHSVRWVYAMVTERQPFGLRFTSSALIYFILNEREEISVSVPKSKVLLVSRTLNRVLPNADFGYTEERDLQYRGEITGKRTFGWNLWDEDQRL